MTRLSDVVIRAEGLGKKYLIGHEAQRERYVALRDVVARNFRGFVRSAGDVLRGRQLIAGDEVEEFWALKDVGFEVKRGEVLGIIGRNGAGKSTLLKVLSRITEPSAGRVEIKGRVASLLEVGTGFHPELTGRENVYLNGAILGMSRAEIKRKFDEIVAFAEVEKFLDTPVKRYSSGMYVRLAFAVAAHLEPEILVVDEVLAVGDAEFQKKCLGKMGEVAGQGRTVLFVSHNMAAVQALCANAFLIDKGLLTFASQTAAVIRKYSETRGSDNPFFRTSRNLSPIYLTNANGKYEQSKESESAKIKFKLEVTVTTKLRAAFEIRVKDHLGVPVAFATIGGFNTAEVVSFVVGQHSYVVEIDASCLAKGSYLFSVDIAYPNILYFDRAEDCLEIDVDPVVSDGSTRMLEQRYGFGCVHLGAKLCNTY